MKKNLMVLKKYNKLRRIVRDIQKVTKRDDKALTLCPNGCGNYKLDCICDKFHEQRPNSKTWGKQKK